MAKKDTIYIGGRWVASAATGVIEVIDPTTEQVIATVPDGVPADADRAARAARAAFDSWATTSPAERGEALAAMHDWLSARADLVAETIHREMGAPLEFARKTQASLPIDNLAHFAQLAGTYSFEQRLGNSLVLRQPAGVVAAITPWNYPLHQAVAKVAAALAAGCTVVLKPSEVAPLSAYLLAEAAEAAGLPAGVFNLVMGTGPGIGEPLVTHPEIDLVSFTGSTRAGRRIAELAGRDLKRVALELGGKSATVLLPDVDGDLLTTAIKVAVGGCFINAGQTCSALTRLIVPRDRHDEIVARAVEMAAKYQPGERIGPIVSPAQRDRVRGYIRAGIEQGARLATGGVEPPGEPASGFFVRPTIFADVRPEMTIAREEIFGPVLAVLPYDDEAHALALANDSEYGLAGAVWSADQDRAIRFARRMRTGQVDINGGRYNPLAPFGGFKSSGYGRELGVFGLEEFLATTSLQL